MVKSIDKPGYVPGAATRIQVREFMSTTGVYVDVNGKTQYGDKESIRLWMRAVEKKGLTWAMYHFFERELFSTL